MFLFLIANTSSFAYLFYPEDICETSPETSVVTRPTRRHNPEDGIFYLKKVCSRWLIKVIQGNPQLAATVSYLSAYADVTEGSVSFLRNGTCRKKCTKRALDVFQHIAS
jgi:hypothetical protein